MKLVWFTALVLTCLDRPINSGASPVCVRGQAGCGAPSLAELFDRLLQQSSRIHGVSSDAHSDIEQHFSPTRNHIGRRRCHTLSILTPDHKENVQRLGREQLTEVILKLLAAWTDPLNQLLHLTPEDKNQDLAHHDTHGVQQLGQMVQELRSGVAKVAEKMKLQGETANAVGYPHPRTPLPSPTLSAYKRAALSSMQHHELLYCFRRDSNKVKNYLRILKCTTLPEVDC